jgi:hypothetical protein
MSSNDKDQYQPKDAVQAGIKGSLIMGGAGLLASAVQNSLQKRNVGPWAVFTRTGGTVAAFSKRTSTRCLSFWVLKTDNCAHTAAVGGTYEFAKLASANLRERDDSLNTAIGGFIAGSILGLRSALAPFRACE